MKISQSKILYLISFIFLFITSSIAFAISDANTSNVMMQLQAEDWVNTQTAEVTVFIDATLDKTGAIQMRDQVNSKLINLANAPWHITLFDTNKNESGLDQLHVEAAARVPENFIAGLHDKAKDLSKPGIAFKIARIDFTPSLAEFENAKGLLRTKLYLAIKEEVARINKAYPDQKYVLQSVSFQDNSAITPMPYANNLVKLAAPRAAIAGGAVPQAAATDNSAMLAVSSKIQMTAIVILAPAPEPSPEEKKIEKLETSMLHDTWKN